MSTDVQKTMLEAYKPASLVHNYFTSLCKQVNLETEAIEVDIERDDEEVAIVLTSLEQGARSNESSLYTNKEYTPPIFKEKIGIPAGKVIKRLSGEVVNPASVDFQAKASRIAISSYPKIEKKIRRAVELMAAQVFQTNQVTLADAAGVSRFTMSFSPKAAHFPTASTVWTNPAAPTLANIGDLCDVIYRNGKAPVTRLTYGKTAWRNQLAATDFSALISKFGLNRGSVDKPKPPQGGAVHQGTIVVDGHVLELWTYAGFYKHPQTGVMTPYLADNKVVFSGDATEVVAAFGAIPKFPAPAGSSALQYLPTRISGQGFDMTPSAWISEDLEFLTLQAGTRPMVLPVGVDTFGCLTVS